MAKRVNHRTIRAASTYTIEEAAMALAVTVGTIRNWARGGLPVMKAQRPYLILGEALREFLQGRSKVGKVVLGPSQLYCLTCKAARTPMGMMVDVFPQTATTARLMGLCEVCGGTCNRMVGRSRMAAFGEIFDVALRDRQTA